MAITCRGRKLCWLRPPLLAQCEGLFEQMTALVRWLSNADQSLWLQAHRSASACVGASVRHTVVMRLHYASACRHMRQEKECDP
jgi:hypothetical protein